MLTNMTLQVMMNEIQNNLTTIKRELSNHGFYYSGTRVKMAKLPSGCLLNPKKDMGT